MVGEPSSSKTLGDVVKNGRRGSITGNLYIQGIQGHVAYPHLAENPIHKAAPFLQELTRYQWDNGNEFFPPTSLQIANIHAGTGSNNVDALTTAIEQTTGITPQAETGGGTSDGRFIALMGAEVVEFGPLNATIHKVNECVSVDDLAKCGQIYHQMLVNLLDK